MYLLPALENRQHAWMAWSHQRENDGGISRMRVTTSMHANYRFMGLLIAILEGKVLNRTRLENMQIEASLSTHFLEIEKRRSCLCHKVSWVTAKLTISQWRSFSDHSFMVTISMYLMWEKVLNMRELNFLSFKKKQRKEKVAQIKLILLQLTWKWWHSNF